MAAYHYTITPAKQPSTKTGNGLAVGMLTANYNKPAAEEPWRNAIKAQGFYDTGTFLPKGTDPQNLHRAVVCMKKADKAADKKMFGGSAKPT